MFNQDYTLDYLDFEGTRLSFKIEQTANIDSYRGQEYFLACLVWI